MLSRRGHSPALSFPRQAPPTFLPRRKQEEASIALDDRCRRLSAARDPSTENGLGQEAFKLFGQGCRQRQGLIADRDNKIWLVSNPETLLGIEGRHVKVKALA